MRRSRRCWNSTFAAAFGGHTRVLSDAIDVLRTHAENARVPVIENALNAYGLSRQTGVKTRADDTTRRAVQREGLGVVRRASPVRRHALDPRRAPIFPSPFPRASLIRRETFDETPLASSIAFVAERAAALFRAGGVVESATTFGSEAFFFSESDAGFFGDARDEGNPLKKRNTWFDDVPGTYETTIVLSPPAQVLFDNGQRCVDTNWNCGGDNRDTNVRQRPRFSLPDDRTVAYVVGAPTTRRPETRCTRTWRCMIRRGSSACSRSTMASLRNRGGVDGRHAGGARRRSCSSSRSRGNVPPVPVFYPWTTDSTAPTRTHRRARVVRGCRTAHCAWKCPRGVPVPASPDASVRPRCGRGRNRPRDRPGPETVVFPRWRRARRRLLGQKNGGRAARRARRFLSTLGRVGHVLTIGLRFVARVVAPARFVAVVVEDALCIPFRSRHITTKPCARSDVRDAARRSVPIAARPLPPPRRAPVVERDEIAHLLQVIRRELPRLRGDGHELPREPERAPRATRAAPIAHSTATCTGTPSNSSPAIFISVSVRDDRVTRVRQHQETAQGAQDARVAPRASTGTTDAPATLREGGGERENLRTRRGAEKVCPATDDDARLPKFGALPVGVERRRRFA